MLRSFNDLVELLRVRLHERQQARDLWIDKESAIAAHYNAQCDELKTLIAIVEAATD